MNTRTKEYIGRRLGQYEVELKKFNKNEIPPKSGKEYIRMMMLQEGYMVLLNIHIAATPKERKDIIRFSNMEKQNPTALAMVTDLL